MEGYESASDKLSFIDIELNSSEISTEYVYKDIESGHIGKKDYLYSRELKKIEEWVGRYRETNVGGNYQKDSSDFLRKADFSQNTNNIFSVYGNRGSGKSSFIQTVRYKVQNDTENTGYFRRKNIHVLPLIDPSIFDGRIDIIELFVSMLKSEVEKIKTNSREQSNFGHFEDQVFLEKTTKIIDVLKMLRLESSVFAEKRQELKR
ncbi:P-loop NTPase fold protein [Enterococcus gallinarum]|uniref:P-loop NTPase fold protein n=1 Tax=Enterococcus gallinarum TaxID=1353 RepID=UPI003BF7F9A8